MKTYLSLKFNCFVILTYKFHFISTILLSRQLIWGWLLYIIGSKTHLVSSCNSRYVKQTIAYKSDAWWVLMLHYIYYFFFIASGSMTSFFPRNKICRTVNIYTNDLNWLKQVHMMIDRQPVVLTFCGQGLLFHKFHPGCRYSHTEHCANWDILQKFQLVVI